MRAILAGTKKEKAELKITKKGVTWYQFFMEAIKKGGRAERIMLINSILFLPILFTNTPLGSIKMVAKILANPITKPI
jgi:hypothetical protein